jgi:hypothetical protein
VLEQVLVLVLELVLLLRLVVATLASVIKVTMS